MYCIIEHHNVGAYCYTSWVERKGHFPENGNPERCSVGVYPQRKVLLRSSSVNEGATISFALWYVCTGALNSIGVRGDFLKWDR